MKAVSVDVRVETGVLDRIVYTLEHDGVVYYRVVKLVRLLRNPREYAQIETALEIHRDFISSTRELPNTRLILLACNSKRLGLIWCYGVAVTGFNLEEIEELAEDCFYALVSSLKGSYRQALFRLLTRDEAYEILRIMQSDNGLAIYGIPEPRDSYARRPRFLGFQIGVKIVEMVEELIRGLMGKEFVYMVLAEPIEPKKLISMLQRVSDLASKYSDFQESVNIGFGLSIPVGFTLSQGLSESLARQLSRSRGVSESESRGRSHVVSKVKGVAETESEASTKSVSRGHSVAESEVVTRGTALTEGASHSTGASRTIGSSETVTEVKSTTKMESVSRGRATAKTESWSIGAFKSKSEFKSKTKSEARSESYGIEGGLGFKGFVWGGGSYERGFTKGTSESLGTGASRGTSEVRGGARSVQESETITIGKSKTVSRGTSRTAMRSTTTSIVDTVSRSKTISESISRGRAITESEVVTEGLTKGLSRTLSEQRGISDSESLILTQGKSIGVSSGRSTGLTRVSSESVIAGLWPSIHYSYTRMRTDEIRRLAYQLLQLESMRYQEMVSQGGFYVQSLIIAPEKSTVLSAKALIIGAYSPTRLVPHPLRVLEADSELLQLARTFSFDLRRKRSELEPYQYLNIYTCTELASLTHPPRLEASGLETVVENIPEFRLPSPKHYDVEFGNVISHETGEITEIRYGVNRSELLHALFLGITRSGKTNAAMIFVSRLVNNVGARALILDWKKDWRRLLKICKPCRFYTLYSDKFYPLKFNPLKPPKGVDVETWRDIATLWFAMTYGLGPRSYSLIWSKLDELYEAKGLYDNPNAEAPTLDELYNIISNELIELRRDRRIPFDVLDIYQKTLDRLKFFTRGKFKKLFCAKDSIDIGELLSEKGIVVIEAGELADIHKPFLLGLLAIACFYYRKFNGASDIPELIVMEEAHQIAFDVTKSQIAGMLNITEGIFDRIASESAGYNQYLVMIAQYPSILGDGVRKNTGLLVTFKLVSEYRYREDLTMTVGMLARDSKMDHREVWRFLTRLPIGWSVVRKMHTFDLIETEPVLIKWDYLEVKPPSDSELRNF